MRVSIVSGDKFLRIVEFDVVKLRQGSGKDRRKALKLEHLPRAYITIGHFRVTMGNLRLTIGYLEATVFSSH